MNIEDKKKLAEFMGWEVVAIPEIYAYWRPESWEPHSEKPMIVHPVKDEAGADVLRKFLRNLR